MIAEAGQLAPPIASHGPHSCAHCGLPVPPGLLDRARHLQFCCHGCETAYSVIHGCGLDAYYRLRKSSEASAAPARGTGGRYAEFDDPAFRKMYCSPASQGLLTTELVLEGIHCSACVWLLERLPSVLPGVVDARLDIRRSLIRITWLEAELPLSRIARTLDSLGYAPHPARNVSARDVRRLDDRRMLIRLGVAGACAGNVMLLALALYAGMFDAMEAQYRELFRWLSMGISLVALVWPGSVFFRGAWSAIRTRTPHLDLPIAMGLGAGLVWGVMNTIRGTGEIYFDSLSVLVFALLAGRLVQHRQQRWAADSVELLFSLTPTSCRVIRAGVVTHSPIEAVAPGDEVEVLAGDSIPVDGAVAHGISSIDQSLLTGESRPVAVSPGDSVSAGAVNLSARLVVRVEATGEHTRVGRLMRMVEEATRRRAPIVLLADRLAVWFVAVMLVLAAITVAAWWHISPSQAIDHAAALLIVTCPCGLGLATPLAVTVAVGRAARRGMLIKGGDAIQSLGGRGRILLDKTGTITQGRTALVRWHGPAWIKPLVSAVESTSSHPIARALVAGCGPATLAAANVRSQPRGLEGEVDDRELLVGSAAFVRELTGSSALVEVEHEMADAGLTPVLIAIDGRIRAAAGLGDPIREDARAAVDALRSMGWSVGVLSGDHPRVVAAVGRQLGIDPADLRGGASPEDKLATVTEACASGTLVMVGDGVNDAAALAAATVGIAVHGGAEASLAAADVYLNRPGLSPIAEMVRGSRRTMDVIRTNFAISIVYNVIAAGLCMSGLINPLLAAIIMPASSLTVLSLSFRSRTFGRTSPCR